MKSPPHLFAMAPLSTWMQLLWEGGGVTPRYWARLTGILLSTTLAVPLRIAQRVRYGRRVARTTIDEPPIFVLGYPRTGTTHLHYLLAQDPQFGVVTNFQAAFPTFFLIGRGWLKRLAARAMPATRPMDNVAISLDMPQEEEFAIANSCHLSWLHHFSFPRRADALLERYVLLRGLKDREQARWDRVFLDVLRRATLDASGRRLLLKSPVNTGRVSHLLRLFPGAKFVHIVRNPYVVYRSMMHLYGKFIPLNQLQQMDAEDMADHAVRLYRAMMGQFLKDRALIPDGQFTEVRFEELEARPLEVVERIYSNLSLPGWEQARPRVEAYCDTIAGYRKNAFRIDRAVIDRVNREWGFALRVWPYDPPDADDSGTRAEARRGA